MTDLMYGRRVSKDDPRVVTCGSVDELTSCLGVARAASATCDGALAEPLEALQRTLIVLMGQISTDPEDRGRYRDDGFVQVDQEEVEALTARCADLEQDLERFHSWVLPGAAGVPAAAYLDMARALARRAERHLIALERASPAGDHQAIVFLNRLSDYLWLLARVEEKRAGTQRPPSARP